MITALLIVTLLLMLIVSAALLHWIWREDEDESPEQKEWKRWD